MWRLESKKMKEKFVAKLSKVYWESEEGQKLKKLAGGCVAGVLVAVGLSCKAVVDSKKAKDSVEEITDIFSGNYDESED